MSRRSPVVRGWSGGAMVLGKLSVPRRLTNLDNSRARAALAVGVRVGVVWTFLSSSIFSPFFLPLSETVRYRLTYVSKGR